MSSVHKSVLLHESIDILNLKEEDIFVDGTIAGGGHSAEVCKRYGSTVRVIGIDIDPDALRRARERLDAAGCNATLYQGSFRHIDEILRDNGVEGVDAILFDLGWSSDQFETSGRGFSFNRDEPLLMTLGDPDTYTFTARDLVNTLDADKLETIIRVYGEERLAKRIANEVVAERTNAEIETSGQLAEIIEKTVPRRGKLHPATKTFQALRIAVNDELETLEIGLRNAFDMLRPGGRLAIITFHSLEDRMVKQVFKKLSQDNKATPLTKKPIRPSRTEATENPRSRSAKLRAVKKSTTN